MATVVVQYDIHDAVVRQHFQTSITDPAFVPRFREITESVYAATMNCTPAALDALRLELLALLGAYPPVGTRVILMTPTSTNNAPDIQLRILVNIPMP